MDELIALLKEQNNLLKKQSDLLKEQNDLLKAGFSSSMALPLHILNLANESVKFIDGQLS